MEGPVGIKRTFTPDLLLQRFLTWQRLRNVSSNETSNFSRGTLFRLANGRARKIEDLRMEDFNASWQAFCQGSLEAQNFRLCWARVTRIASLNDQESLIGITFTVHPGRKRTLPPPQLHSLTQFSYKSFNKEAIFQQLDTKIFLENIFYFLYLKITGQKATIQHESWSGHPFFVFAEGWAAGDPTACFQKHGLICKRLAPGDDCLVLLKRGDVSLNLSKQSNKVNSLKTVVRTPKRVGRPPNNLLGRKFPFIPKNLPVPENLLKSIQYSAGHLHPCEWAAKQLPVQL